VIHLHFAAWPDSAQMIRGLTPVIDRTGCPCLVAENDVVHYYLIRQTAHDTFTTVFVMKYRDAGGSSAVNPLTARPSMITISALWK
jgi:hypothetical protein